MLACASKLLKGKRSEDALRSALDELTAGLGAPADLLVAFASPDRADDLDWIVNSEGAGKARHVLACTGESIAGREGEVEEAPALALWALRAPEGVALHGVRIEPDQGAVEASDPLAGTQASSLLLLGDPFTFPADAWLKHWNTARPTMPVLGGMASAGRQPGSNRLALDGQVFRDGAVGIGFEGPMRVRAVVSQGCRPIGRTLLITRAERNLIHELGRRPALEALKEIVESLEEEEQELVRKGLHVGRVINEYQETFDRGDFLIRNVMGATEDGSIGITDLVRVGQTVQFQVRDAETAHQDLIALLSVEEGGKPTGALLFTCNGRGSRMFEEPDHDVSAIHEVLGGIPLAGFFAMGEFGPIGGQNFVHGFTASVALFEQG